MPRRCSVTRNGRPPAGGRWPRGSASAASPLSRISGPGADERRYLDEVWQGSVPIHQFSWSQNTALLRRARVYVGPDTSTSHLAAATGCPTVALFGPMDPRVWGPWPARRNAQALGRERHDPESRQCVDRAEPVAMPALHVRRLRAACRQQQRMPPGADPPARCWRRWIKPWQTRRPRAAVA